MKKSVSLILACAIMITSVLSVFTGCVKAEASNKLLVSEWLGLINQKFGFEGYSQSEPYISGITADNASFDDIQTAFEYYVLPEGYTALNPDSEVSREFCALTLAGAIYTPNSKELNIADYDKLMFPESVKSVINYGVMTLDDKGNFNPSDKVEYGEAIECLDKAYYSFTHMFLEREMSFEFADNVIDFAGYSTVDQSNGKDGFRVDTNYVDSQTSWLKDNNFSYDEKTSIATIDNIDEKNIEEGSIIILPQSVDYPEGLYIKVESISENEGKYVLKTSEPELDEIFPNGFTYQGSDVIDFSNAIFYDADDNIVGIGWENPDPSVAATISYNTFDPSMSTAYDMNVGGNLSFPVYVGGKKAFDFKIKTSNGKIDTSVDVTLKKDGNKSTKISFGKTFSDFGVDSKVSINPLDEMRLGLRYDVIDTYSIKKSYKNSGIDKYEKSKPGRPKNSEKELLNSIVEEIKSQAGGTDVDISQTIGKVHVPIGSTPVYFDFKIIWRFTSEGSFDISLTYDNQSMGMQKRKGLKGITPYYDLGTKTNTSVTGSAKIENTIGFNFAASVLRRAIADVEVAVGAGVKGEAKINYVNASHQKVYEGYEVNEGSVAYCAEMLELELFAPAINTLMDTANVVDDIGNVVVSGEIGGLLICGDIKVYPIVKITACTDDCLIGKYLGSASWDILGSKSTPLVEFHGEMDSSEFHFTECTLADRIDDGIKRGDHIEISPLADISMNIDDKKTYEITMLPETKKRIYTLSDIVIETVDKKTGEKSSCILIEHRFNEKSKGGLSGLLPSIFKKKVNNEELKENAFKITAISGGDALVTVRTRDGQFKTEPISVHVNTPEQAENKTVILGSFTEFVAIGETITIPPSAIPFGKDDTSVFWEIDDESIARVNAVTGEITGVSEGSCTVKAYIPGYENSEQYCLINVTQNYTAAILGWGAHSGSDEWIKIEGLPVIIIERV